MLKSLSVRNIVLIEKADLTLEGGLTVITGETGAGKSILLDCLGLVLGARADKGLIRAGAAQASVGADFAVPPGHPAFSLLSEAGLEGVSDELLLRRTLSEAGGGRAFVNDQPVSLATLRAVGATLVELHGQHDERGLLNPAGHRALLDAYGRLGPQTQTVENAFSAWRAAQAALEDRRELRARAEAEADFIRLAAEELSALAPEEGEEERLAEERALLSQASKIAADLGEVEEILAGGDGLSDRLAQALRRLERAPDEAQGLVRPISEAIDRVLIELREARERLGEGLRALPHDAGRLEAVDERLHALRAAARKHRVSVALLPAKWREVEAAYGSLERSSEDISRLTKDAVAAEAAFRAAAEALRGARLAAAKKLDASVNAELEALRLGQAEFSTLSTAVDLDRAGPSGLDRVEFQVSTNKGGRPGPLIQIASGGELSRFILALKVVLAATTPAATLIFDEIDRGVGGAVADSIGERLARLSKSAQVLIVTHSPQVAARGEHHFLAEKAEAGGTTKASVHALTANGRIEEIARMLSGAEVTDEARAAARRLLGPADAATGKSAKSDRAKPKAKSA